MTTTIRRRLTFGLAVGALYAVVAVVTIRSTDSHVRPLFEGIGPSAPYHWVNPPKAFAAGNVNPQPSESQVSLGPNGNLQAGSQSPDGQILLNLPEGAIASHPPDDHVTVRLVPLDPATLAKAPDGQRPNGNAYKVELSYQPSAQAIDVLARPGNVILTVPEPAQGLLFSVDGRAWQKLETQNTGGVGTVGGPFGQAGYYVGAASSFTAPSDGGSGGGGSSDAGAIILVGALTVGLAFLLGFGPSLWRRLQRKRQRPEAPAVRAARTQQATARKRKTKRRRRSGG